MKPYQTPVLLFFTVFAGSAKGYHLRRSHDGENWFPRGLLALDSDVTGCIEVKDGRTNVGNKFILGDCRDRNNGIEPMGFGDDVMFEVRKDTSMCMQATHSGTLEHGARMRIYPCNFEEPLQHFEWSGTSVRLKGTNWCVIYDGNKPDVNEDEMVIKDCNHKSAREEAWSYD